MATTKPAAVRKRRSRRKSSHRRRPIKATSSGTASTAVRPTTTLLTNVDGALVDREAARPPNGVRPSYWRYFQACLSLLERGVPPTLVNIAKELHVSRQAVWALQRRLPDLLAWINTEFVGRNKEYLGMVQFRCAQLAMQGSAAHAELFLRSLTMGFGTIEPEGTVPAGIQVVQNFLVPRPEMPSIEAPKNVTPAPLTLPGNIPTLALR